MATLAEQQLILQQIHTLGMGDLNVLWQQAQNSSDFFAYIVEAFPELLAQYGVTAADFAATWYEDAAPALAYRATPADLPPLEKYAESARWAMGSGGGGKAIEKLSGVLQRNVWDMARETTIANSASEKGATWARHASANACEFCRVVATRGAVYSSEAAATRVAGRGKDVSTNFDANGKRKSGGQAKGVRTRGTQKVGDKYHDHCHCMAVAVRPGSSYQPPDYVSKWEAEYVQAVRDTKGKGEYGAIDLKAVTAAMRQNAK